MPTEEVKIPIETIDKSPNAWRQLLTNIKETKAGLVDLEQQGKRGTAEWDNYVRKLQSLAETKRVVQREMKLTGDQLLNLSKNLGVIAFSINNAIKDTQNLIQTFKEGKATFSDTSIAILQIGTSALSVLPAIEALHRAFPVLTAALGTFSGIVAGVVAQVAMLYKVFSDLPKAIDSVKQILSGANVWDLWINKTAELTFGLIDFREQGLDPIPQSVNAVRASLIGLGDSLSSLTKVLPWITKGFVKSGFDVPTKEEMTPQQLANADFWRWEQDAKNKTPQTGKGKSPLTGLKEDVLDISKKIPDLEKLAKIVQELWMVGTPKLGGHAPLAESAFDIQGGGTQEGLFKSREEQERQINNMMVDAFSQSLTISQQIYSLFGQGASEIINAFQTAFSLASSIISFIGLILKISSGGIAGAAFAEGGYTGDGGKYDPAGIVHAGEFVFSKEETAKYRPLFEMLHRNKISGAGAYADGGLVTPMSNTTTINPVFNFYGTLAGQKFLLKELPVYNRNEGRINVN